MRSIDMTTGAATLTTGPVATIGFSELSSTSKLVELWLPHNEVTELVGLRSDAALEPAPPDRRSWVHHGSSISHGSNAESPSTTWPALAASRAGVDLVNLGFGGGALLDPFVARTMRDLPANLLSVKIGINLVNTDLMRLRALAPAVHGFLDTIREGHPTTPLLVISPIWCEIHERTPGPAAPDLTALAEGRLSFAATGDPTDRTRLTLETIRDVLAAVVVARAADDPHLQYLDGRELYGEADSARLPLPDQLHPDAEPHRIIGERFAEHPLRRCASCPPHPPPTADVRRPRPAAGRARPRSWRPRGSSSTTAVSARPTSTTSPARSGSTGPSSTGTSPARRTCSR